MIGGIVLDTVDNPKTIRFRVKDNKTKKVDVVYVERDVRSRCVSEGDLVWWQSGIVYWTPKHHIELRSESQVGEVYDIALHLVSVVKQPVTAK